jgi:hypothetical protein
MATPAGKFHHRDTDAGRTGALLALGAICRSPRDAGLAAAEDLPLSASALERRHRLAPGLDPRRLVSFCILSLGAMTKDATLMVA